MERLTIAPPYMLPVNNNSPKRRRRIRMVNPYRYSAPRWVGWLFVAVLSVALVVSVVIWARHVASGLSPHSALEETVSEMTGGKLCSYPGRTFSYADKFNAPNATHIDAAEAVGIRPCADDKELNQQKARLRKIRTCHNYVVDDLDYSVPYLTIAAANELNVIGEAFADILERNGCPHYRFIITSVLRTDESVKSLQKSGNINATSNSAHRYGTTFDITYRRFDKHARTADYMNEENIKLALAQVLLNEQRAGHIYVKYEYKQACFHVTSRL